MLIFATRLKFTERAIIIRLSTNNVDLASEGHGEHRPSPGAGDGVHCGREGRKLYLDRISVLMCVCICIYIIYIIYMY